MEFTAAWLSACAALFSGAAAAASLFTAWKAAGNAKRSRVDACLAMYLESYQEALKTSPLVFSQKFYSSAHFNERSQAQITFGFLVSLVDALHVSGDKQRAGEWIAFLAAFDGPLGDTAFDASVYASSKFTRTKIRELQKKIRA